MDNFDRSRDEFFMRLALKEASKGLGSTSPNPVVGALVVKGGRIIARGYHQRAGKAHAEVVALAAAGRRASGADLYVTLEPCDHYGRTPPCSLSILKAGIRRVIFASRDPNPLVNGQGIARLRVAGVDVVSGILQEDANKLNQPFFKVIRTGFPYVSLKAVVTLDGKLVTEKASDTLPSIGKQTRAWMRQLRDRTDAILMDSSAMMYESPYHVACLPSGMRKNMMRVVVDPNLRFGNRLSALIQRFPARTAVVTFEAPEGRKAQHIRRTGTEIWQVEDRSGRVSTEAVLRRVAKEGFNRILIEGGKQTYSSFLRENLADEIALLVIPKLSCSNGPSWAGVLKTGGMRRPPVLYNLNAKHLGENLLLHAAFHCPA